MTDRINRYMQLKNSPITGSLEEEKKLIDEMLTIIGDTPKVESRYVVRYIVDTGNKKTCVYETGWAAESEVAFVIDELQKEHGCRVFATIEHIYEVAE